MTPLPEAALTRMVAVGRLQAVPPSPAQGRRLLDQARTHLSSARGLAAVDPEGAYSLAYDGARKALVGLLAARGLRPTAKGGHVVVLDATTALLGPAADDVLRPFDRMRRRRNQVEYPSGVAAGLVAEDVLEDADRIERIIDFVADALDGD